MIFFKKFRKAIDRRSEADRRRSDISLPVYWERRIATDRRNEIKSSENEYASKSHSLKFMLRNLVPEADEASKSKFIQRAFERFNYRTPILFEDCETHTTSKGTLYNYSKGGMYLEADCFPMQGSGAQIHIVNYSPDASEPEDLSRYFTEVKWVKKHSGLVDPNRYGIGVKYCTNTEDLFRLFGH